jgi:hypothetical protein
MNNLNDSRALLYYASPETDISPTEQNDLYGRLIEKKRVGVSLPYLMLLSYIHAYIFFLLYPLNIYLLFILAAFFFAHYLPFV